MTQEAPYNFFYLFLLEYQTFTLSFTVQAKRIRAVIRMQEKNSPSIREQGHFSSQQKRLKWNKLSSGRLFFIWFYPISVLPNRLLLCYGCHWQETKGVISIFRTLLTTDYFSIKKKVTRAFQSLFQQEAYLWRREVFDDNSCLKGSQNYIRNISSGKRTDSGKSRGW